MTIYGSEYTLEWTNEGEESPNQDWFKFSSGTNLYTIETGVAGPNLLSDPYGVAAYDSNRNVIVYVNGGFYDELGTWELDLDTNTWSNVTHAPSQPSWSGDSTYPGHWAAMTFDSTNNQMILITMALWKDATIYTWDGVSGQWSSHSPGTWFGYPISGYWPDLEWDSSRDKLWVFFRWGGMPMMIACLVDPSDWSTTYVWSDKSWEYACATNTINWEGSRAFIYFGGIEVEGRTGWGEYGGDISPYTFLNDTYAIVETSPGSYSRRTLTNINSPPSQRGYVDCVVDDDNNKIYIVGGLHGDPFHPIPRADTWEGVVNSSAETITWTNLGVAPPSSLGWGTHITAR